MENGSAAETLAGDTSHRTIPTTLSSSSAGGFPGIFNLAARRPMASLRRLWNNCYPRGAFGEEAVFMPGPVLSFVVSGLLSFVEIKSQGHPEFPFQTHPLAVMVAITSLLMYGFSSGAEQNHRVPRIRKLTPAPAPPLLLHDDLIVYTPL